MFCFCFLEGEAVSVIRHWLSLLFTTQERALSFKTPPGAHPDSLHELVISRISMWTCNSYINAPLFFLSQGHSIQHSQLVCGTHYINATHWYMVYCTMRNFMLHFCKFMNLKVISSMDFCIFTIENICTLCIILIVVHSLVYEPI